MLKLNTIGITLEEYNNFTCTDIINKTIEHFDCYLNNNINSCCNENINFFYNYLNNSKIEQNTCYIFHNKSYELSCDLISYKYHLFVYFLLFLIIITNLIVLIYSICYCFKYRKYNRYQQLKNNIMMYKSNNLYSRNNDSDDIIED